MIKTTLTRLALVGAAYFLALPTALASPHEAGARPEVSQKAVKRHDGRIYSPFVGRDYPDQVLFGDMHFHTEVSFDAGLIGTTLDVDDGYRFAKGEPVVHPFARNRVQINEPLDFLAVADHAEYLGVLPPVLGGDFEQPEAGLFEKLKSWVLM